MAPDARPHNLPLQPTPLLGRERELAEVTALRETLGIPPPAYSRANVEQVMASARVALGE